MISPQSWEQGIQTPDRVNTHIRCAGSAYSRLGRQAIEHGPTPFQYERFVSAQKRSQSDNSSVYYNFLLASASTP
jgi:hypothetical protein